VEALGGALLAGEAGASDASVAGAASGKFQLSTMRENIGSIRTSDAGAHFKATE